MITDKLGNHVEILSGFAFKSDRFNVDGKGLPLVRIRDVKPRKSGTFYDGEFEERYVLSDGDMLVGMDGEFNCARWNGGRALLNQRVCRIRAKSPKLDEQYLFWFLPKVLKEIEELSNFVTVKHLSSKQINEIEIPLLPLEEQKRIAAILDQADDIRRKRQHAIDRLNQLGQAIFHEMFGDIENNSLSFHIFDMSKIIHLQGGYAFKSENYQPSGIPVVRIGEVNTNFAKNYIFHPRDDKLQRFILKPEDMVLSLTGTVGKDDYCNIAKVPNNFDDYYLNQRVARVTVDPEMATDEFVMRLFSLPYVKHQAIRNNRGIRQANLSNADVYQIKIPLPPIEAQMKFSEKLKNIQNTILCCQGSQVKHEILFASLQHRAFAGEL